MRSIALLLCTLLVTVPLAPQPWQQVKAALQAKYPSYDACLGLALHALLTDTRIIPRVRGGLDVATTEIITQLPEYIQGTINSWPNKGWENGKKWQSITDMHHAQCVLAGAVQLQLALAVLRNGTIPQVPRLLLVQPGHGPRPEDSSLRKAFGEKIYEVQFALAKKDMAQAVHKTQLMLKSVSQ